MGNYTTFLMFENPRRGRQARNFTENDPKILDLKWSSEQIIFPKLSLGAPVKLTLWIKYSYEIYVRLINVTFLKRVLRDVGMYDFCHSVMLLFAYIFMHTWSKLNSEF